MTIFKTTLLAVVVLITTFTLTSLIVVILSSAAGSVVIAELALLNTFAGMVGMFITGIPAFATTI